MHMRAFSIRCVRCGFVWYAVRGLSRRTGPPSSYAPHTVPPHALMPQCQVDRNNEARTRELHCLFGAPDLPLLLW